MHFIEILVQSIVENRFMPKVQVERELAPFFDIFIESCMTRLGDSIELSFVEKGKYILVAPEFPLQVMPLSNEEKVTERSTNIDYLLYNTKTQCLYFVEIKTDSNSFEARQFDQYCDVINRVQSEGASFLFSFISKRAKSNAPSRKKYLYYQEKMRLEQLPDLEKIRKCRLVYIAPEKLIRSNKRRNEANRKRLAHDLFLHYRDLYTFSDIEHQYVAEWKMITKTLMLLDEN